MSSADTAAYDRLSAKQAYFDTLLLAPGTSTGTGNVALQNSPTFNGLSTSGIIGSGDYGDLRITSARNIFLTATNGVTIGSNTFPNGTGTVGQVLTTNGAGNVVWSAPLAGSVTSVSASAPLASSGGSTPTISFTGALPVANGGTGATAVTGTGSNVLSINPFFGGSTTITNTVASGDASILYMNRSGGGGVNSAIGVVSANNQIINTTLANELVIGTASGIRIYGEGQVFLKSNTFINIDGASTRFNNISYLSQGTGTSGGNGFVGTTCPIGSGTIRAAGGAMYLGSDTAGVTILSAGGVGVFANSNRIDIKGYGAYYGTATAADFVDSYKPTLTTGVQGDSLTYNAATGRFTNSIGVAVLVTMTYSVLASQPPGTRVGRKCLIRKNGVSAAGSEFGFTQTVVSDWSTGSATIRLAPTDYLQVMSEFFGGVAGAAGAYDSYSNITYVLTAAV